MQNLRVGAATRSDARSAALRTIDRSMNPAGSSGLFGVIRDGDRVWVDTDQDLSFADETGMRQYSRNFQVSYFGTDNPATPVRETVPFVIQVEHALVGTWPASPRATACSAAP